MRRRRGPGPSADAGRRHPSTRAASLLAALAVGLQALLPLAHETFEVADADCDLRHGIAVEAHEHAAARGAETGGPVELTGGEAGTPSPKSCRTCAVCRSAHMVRFGLPSRAAFEGRRVEGSSGLMDPSGALLVRRPDTRIHAPRAPPYPAI